MIEDSILNDAIAADENNQVDKQTLEKHLCLLFDAILSVPRRYYSEDVSNDNISLPKGFKYKNEQIDHVERSFAYELYHRWSCLLCRNSDGYMLNGEIGKYLKWFYGNDYNDNGRQKYPDIVLHKGMTENDQMIVCEIKRMDNISSGIVDDLNKLCRFVYNSKECERNRFFNSYHIGIYLITNVEASNNIENKAKDSLISKSNWDNKIFNIIMNKANRMQLLKCMLIPPKVITKKIICVYSQWDSEGNYSLSYQSLYNILLLNKDGVAKSDDILNDNKCSTIITDPIDADK